MPARRARHRRAGLRCCTAGGRGGAGHRDRRPGAEVGRPRRRIASAWSWWLAERPELVARRDETDLVLARSSWSRLFLRGEFLRGESLGARSRLTARWRGERVAGRGGGAGAAGASLGEGILQGHEDPIAHSTFVFLR